MFDINGLSFSWRTIRHGGRPLPAALGGGAAGLLWRSGNRLEVGEKGGRGLRMPGGACHLRPCAGLHLASQCARVSGASAQVVKFKMREDGSDKWLGNGLDRVP